MESNKQNANILYEGYHLIKAIEVNLVGFYINTYALEKRNIELTRLVHVTQNSF